MAQQYPSPLTPCAARWRIRWSILGLTMAAVVLLALGVVALIVLARPYRSATRILYTGVAFDQLRADCERLYVAELAKPRVDAPDQRSGTALPPEVPYLRSLHPKFVCVGRYGVVVQVEGGGVVGHGGFYVAFDTQGLTLEELAKKYQIVVVDSPRQVFRYGLYDYRILPFN